MGRTTATPAPTVEPLGDDDPDAVEWLTTAQTAALIRAALKAAFPGVKFSVRSSNYSMGSSIDVSWTDGPTPTAVEKVTNAYRGADFDSMEDIKRHRGPVKITDAAGNVRRVRLGTDYVHTHRDLSPDYAARFEPLAAEILGEPLDRGRVYDRDYPTRWGTWTAYTGEALIRWLAERVDPDNPGGDDQADTEPAAPATAAAELDARTAAHLIGQWLPRTDGTVAQVADVERFRGALGNDDCTGVTYTDGVSEVYRTIYLPEPVPAPEPAPVPAEPIAGVVDLAARRATRAAAAQAEPEPAGLAPMQTVGDFRTALTVGSLWYVTDHRTPRLSGPRRITRNHGRTFDYTGTFADGSPLVNGGQTYHPRAEECRVAGDLVHFVSESDPGRVLVTWRRIDRPAGDPVPVEDVKPGAYAFAVGQSEYGDTMAVTGYIASAGRVKATRRRKRSGAREMVALYVTENPGGWNGWRTTVYVDLGVTVQPVAEPRAAVAQAAPKPAAQEPAGDEPREDTPAQKWALIVQAGGFFDPSKRQHGRKARAYVAMARVHGLPENPIPTTAQILAAQKADFRPDDYIRRAYLAEYGRMLADVPAAEVHPVDRIALPFAEAEADAQAEPERYAPAEPAQPPRVASLAALVAAHAGGRA